MIKRIFISFAVGMLGVILFLMAINGEPVSLEEEFLLGLFLIVSVLTFLLLSLFSWIKKRNSSSDK